jgi:inhibitor of KinA sporulation pathway (predicted exonuclease)
MAASPPDRSAYAVVFDLEFTAWEGSQERGWLAPGEYPELVQIGAVKVDNTFLPLAEFDRLVRPRLNPKLSGYMQRLTAITDDDIGERGVDFVEAYRDFIAFAGDLPILSFGRDDLVFVENTRLYGLKDLTPLPPFVDLRGWLQAQGIDITSRRFHACDVGPAAGVPFEGHAHNGLADAYSVAAGVAALMARGAPPPRTA